MTTLPAREFGKGVARALPASKELALRAITSEPVRGKLPVRPVESDPAAGAGGQTPAPRQRRGDTLVIRNPTDPDRTLVERKTGAASRKPGLALDEELRRGRIYNNREPRVTKVDRGDANIGGGGNTPIGDNAERGTRNNSERGTGAVARPARPIRTRGLRDGASGDDAGTKTDTPAMKRPIRQVDPGDETVRPLPSVNDGRPERKVRPAERERPNDDNDAPPVYRPSRPERREERMKPEVRDERPTPPVERRQPAREEERPAPRMERPEPRDERPAPPPREERPAPREERSASPREKRRSEPPPQREERKSAPLPREERRTDPTREREASPSRSYQH